MKQTIEERIEWIIHDLAYKPPELHGPALRAHLRDLVKRVEGAPVPVTREVLDAERVEMDRDYRDEAALRIFAQWMCTDPNGEPCAPPPAGAALAFEAADAFMAERARRRGWT